MTIIITIADEKGGVAKTTTVEGLLAALARAGKRVLGIDFDPQGNLADFLGLSPAPGAYTLMAAYIASLAVLMPGNKNKHVQQQVLSTGRENLSLLPGNSQTAVAQAFMLQTERDLTLLRRAIIEQFYMYDFVILDTAPSLGGILELALWAADEVIIPVSCETAGLIGASHTVETLKSLTARGWTGKLAGVLPTFYNETIERRESLLQLQAMFGELCFSPIHECAATRELPANEMTVFEKAEAEKGNKYALRAAQEISDLARRVLK
jgi:chromosome partitioning protein